MTNPPTINYQDIDSRRSRIAYIFEAGFEYFISLLVTDSFLAFLLSELGMNEATVGIVSSLISLAFLFELVAIFVVGKIKNVKRFSIIFHTGSNLLFLSLYLIPFIPALTAVRVQVSIICILSAYFGNYLVTSMIFKWSNSYVDPHKRAVYSSNKEMVSLLGGIIFSVVLGYVMGCYQKADDSRSWFIFGAVTVFVFALCDLICLLLIKKESIEEMLESNQVTIREVIQHTLCNKQFVYVIILASLWRAALYTTVGFMGSYKNLLFDLATVQIINAGANLVRFAFSRPLGKFSDKYSFSKGITLGLVFALIGFGINVFSSPTTRWPVIVFSVLYCLCLGATNQNLYNISYNFVPTRYFVQASAIKNSISGLVGFGASVVAGKILSIIQSSGNSLWGIPVYGQQVLSVISFALVGITILLNVLVIQKQPTLTQ